MNSKVYGYNVAVMFFLKKKEPRAWSEEEIQHILRRFRGGETIATLSVAFKCSEKAIQALLNTLFRNLLNDKELQHVARELDIPMHWINLVILK